MQATFSFTLSDNIVAMEVETFCSAYYRLCDQLVSQQNVVLQVEATCCSFYQLSFNLPRNKFELNDCDWLSAKRSYAAN